MIASCLSVRERHDHSACVVAFMAQAELPMQAACPVGLFRHAVMQLQFAVAVRQLDHLDVAPADARFAQGQRLDDGFLGGKPGGQALMVQGMAVAHLRQLAQGVKPVSEGLAKAFHRRADSADLNDVKTGAQPLPGRARPSPGH